MSPDRAYFAAMQKGMPPLPRPLSPVPTDLPELSPEQLAEGNARQEHC